jgi:integrase
MTVADLIEHYIAKHVRTLRTSKEVERRLRKNVVPVIGATPLPSLHRRDIIRVLDPVLERGAPLESLKVFKDCRALLRWAVERGELDASPMDRMKPPAEEKSRERVLTDDELQVVWHSTALAREDHRTILRLCLLTAQRLGEVTGMVCDEVDLKSSTWTIPAKRSKNGHKHAVPLSAAALALVRDAVTAARGDRLFVGAGDSSSIGKCVSRARFGIAHWTVHDLRRTAVTQMAELGVSPIVLAHVINHRSVTKAGVTLSVYSRYDYAREKREALELWANRLEAIVGGGAIPLVVGENSSSPLRC